jgi:hypothetical protein
MTELTTRALPLNIAPYNLLQYALFLTITERQERIEAISIEHADRSWHELVGQIQGFETGYLDEQEAGPDTAGAGERATCWASHSMA